MPKFPVDAPKRRVVRALATLGFRIVSEREHIALLRDNPDGTKTPLTMPNHSHPKILHVTDHLHSVRNFARRLLARVRTKLG